MFALRNYSDAVDRDLRDAARLAALDEMVCRWLDEIAPYATPLEHPFARWCPGDLIDSLRGDLLSIRGETERLRGPLVMDPD